MKRSVGTLMKKKRTYRWFLVLTIFLILNGLLMGTAAAREIFDMAGRKVSIPDRISKVYVPSPYGSYLIYSIDPLLLATFKVPSDQQAQKYLSKTVLDLPKMSRPQSGQKPDFSPVLAQHPDFVLMWTTDKSHADPEKGRFAEVLKQLNLPVVYVVAASLASYPDIYDFLGGVLGRQQRCRQLGQYCRQALQDAEKIVSRIPAEQRPSVYYAEGSDGLQTECDDSIHVEIFKLLGDNNVHRCHTSNHRGFEAVSFDQVAAYDPDLIIAQDAGFYERVASSADKNWQQLKAVGDGRFHYIPKEPFNWFDRPPSFMRILSLKWLLSVMYPEQYPGDFAQEAREFYHLFLGVDLTPEEIRQVMKQ